jgi:transcriptional regulator with XRE-family HTH domain
MRTAEYLEECKKVLGITSDYKLAKEWEIEDSRISDYKKGKMKPDAYLCFRIAETLHKSPSLVIAELESENSKSAVKSLYFKRFFSTVGLWIILGLALPFYNLKSIGVIEASQSSGSRANSDITAHYTKRRRPKKPTQLWLFLLTFERYFTCN